MTKLGKKRILKLRGLKLSRIFCSSLFILNFIFCIPAQAQEGDLLEEEMEITDPTVTQETELPSEDAEGIFSSAPPTALSNERNTFSSQPDGGPKLVEYYAPIDYSKSYKARNASRTWYVGLDYQPILPKGYRSLIDSTTYEDAYGKESISLGQLVFGPKFNFSLASLGVEIFYGVGEIANSYGGVDSRLSISQTGIRGNVRFDKIFAEPYFVPYFSASYRRIDLEETVSGDKASEAAIGVIGTQLGVLLQLDWLDEDGATRSFVDNGIENVFVDIYAQKLSTPSTAKFNFDTDIDIGGGIGFEF